MNTTSDPIRSAEHSLVVCSAFVLSLYTTLGCLSILIQHLLH